MLSIKVLQQLVCDTQIFPGFNRIYPLFGCNAG